MGELIVTVLIILCSTLVVSIAQTTIPKDPQSVSNWFQNLSNRKPRITRLRFYFHDTVSGSNPTAVFVARAESTASSPTSFGITAVADDPLTVGPDITSTPVGRGQGVYASSQISGGIALYFSLNFVFTNAQYNGSTLSMMGQNPVFEPFRELSIVGGTGYFRLARGIATANTVVFNQTSGDAVVEYNIVVSHYH